jgi:carbonic anhydrase
MSRRNFGALASAATGLSLFPGIVYAAEIDALAFCCIDYRLVDPAVKFFDTHEKPQNYDILALAGASLGAVSDKFPASNEAFWSHVDIAKSLHHIKKVVVLDHCDCGAYKVAFGKDYQSESKAETAQHKEIMEKLKAQLAQKHPDLGYEAWLMALDGSAEKLV